MGRAIYRRKPGDETTDETTFEIGLVLAGGASAGCYIAGVVDYLIDALEHFYEYKDTEGGPSHNVVIKVISGSSAGSITAALTLATIAGAGTRVGGNSHSRGKNPLYTNWVTDITLPKLLDDKDIRSGDDRAPSLLNSALLDGMMEKAYSLNPKAKLPPYVAEELDVFLCVTNLRGIPYRIDAEGDPRSNAGHRMRQHADYFRFALTDTDAPALPLDDIQRLYRGTIGLKNGAWKLLRKSSLASAAIPFIFKARSFERARSDYEHRRWVVPSDRPGQCEEISEIPPFWDPHGNLRFLAVDGGVMNTEPFELARTALSDQAGLSTGGMGRKAVIMVDPFPFFHDTSRFSELDNATQSLVGTLGALLAEARFKPEELTRAQAGGNRTRYLIDPVRTEKDGRQTDPAIQSALCNEMGGFLAEEFRHHDYELGRRNCQKFLREHFTLPGGSRLFGNWQCSAQLKTKSGDIPIIPTPGMNEVSLPDRSGADVVNMKTTMKLVESRMNAVAGRLISTQSGFRLRLGARIAWPFIRNKLSRRLRDYIETELQRARNDAKKHN